MAVLFGSKGFDPYSVDAPDTPMAYLSLARRAAPPVGDGDDDQFAVMSLSSDPSGPRLLDPHQVTPALDGSTDKPDIQARLSLTAFHLGDTTAASTGERATLRIDVGQIERGAGYSDLLFWSAATAMDLLAGDAGKARPSDAAADIQAAFGPRPIDLPAGTGILRFEVVAHEEPPWWRRIFKLARSDAAKALTATLGFPGITQQAVELIDGFLDRLAEVENRPLIRSAPLQLVLTRQARDEYTGGNPHVLAAVLNPGFHVLVRQGDLPRLQGANPVYLAGPGLLVPQADVGATDRKDYRSPLADICYAVIRLRAAEARLEPPV